MKILQNDVKWICMIEKVRGEKLDAVAKYIMKIKNFKRP